MSKRKCYRKNRCGSDLCPTGKNKLACPSCKFFHCSGSFEEGDLDYYCKITKYIYGEDIPPCGMWCWRFRPNKKLKVPRIKNPVKYEQLKKRHIGKTVYYRNRGRKQFEKGKISSYNDKYVHVIYEGKTNSQATCHKDLYGRQ